MSIPDDPRAFRRGQPSNEAGRPPARSDSRNGARQAYPHQEEQFGSFRGGDTQEFAERPAQSQRQPTFSAYRPEAYAAAPRAERQDWPQSENHMPEQKPRPAAEKRAAPRHQPAPERPRANHDPYSAVSNDPYDTGRRDFENAWRSEEYPDQQANQFAASNYYTQREESHNDAQSVHDRFFAADPEPAPAPQPQRYRNDDFSSHDFGAEERTPPRGKPANGAANGGFEDAGGYRWDNFDQAPAPESVRPFPHAKLGGGGHEDELDADYFADEDEFDADEDYAEPKRGGGSKRLMAAVLVGAVVTGGGLAYLYKSQAGSPDGGEPPIMTADTRPIKEQPADPGGREFPNGGKMIYDRLDNAGGSGNADEPTRVASREEQSNTDGVTTTGASGTLEERIQNALRDAKKQDDAPDAASATASHTATSFDTPRPVRTEVFRPDGSVDGSAAKRRQAPPAPAPEPQQAAAAPAAPALASGPSRSREASAQAAAAPSSRAFSTQQIAAVAQTPPSAPAATAITSGGESGMFVQIAARNDQAAAMAAFADLQQKYASVLGNHSPSVRKVDLGDKGVWYRLLVGPMASKGDADKLCEDLKAAGMKGCFSRKE